MAAAAMGDELQSARNLFRGGDARVLETSVGDVKHAAFVQGVFAGNFVPVVRYQIVDAKLAGSFLARLGEQNNVAIQGNFVVVQFQKHE